MNHLLKTTATAIFIGSAVLLAGCSSSYHGYDGSYAGPGGKHSVHWYEKATNIDAMHKEYQWCKQRPKKDHWSFKWLKTTAGVACFHVDAAYLWSINR